MTRREFPDKIKASAFNRARGRCEKCSARLYVGKFHYDHVIPDALGGEPTLGNCEVLCVACHGEKTHARDQPTIAKVKRVRAKHYGGIKRPRSFGRLPCGRDSPWKKKFDGSVVPR